MVRPWIAESVRYSGLSEGTIQIAMPQAREKLVAEFALSPQEKVLWGLRHEDDRLVIGPSGGKRVATVLIGLVGVLIGAGFLAGGLFPTDSFTYNGKPVRNPNALALEGVLLILGVVVYVWNQWRQGIVASPTGLRIRHGFFKDDQLDWSDVAALAMASRREPVRAEIDPVPSFELERNYLSKLDYPIVVREDSSTVELWGLRTASASEGWSASRVSGANMRVDALRRYCESLGLEWQQRQSQRSQAKAWARSILVMILAVTFVFGFDAWVT